MKRILFVFLMFPLIVHADSFYVDASTGNDSNDGSSPGTAWQSINRAESANLAPGDELLFRRGQSFDQEFDINFDGTANNPITISDFGSASQAPIFVGLDIRGSYLIVENVIVDRQQQASDAVRLRNATGVTLRNMVVRNGTKDGIDAGDADDLTVDNVEIHHLLAGSFTDQSDAHGIAVSGSVGVTLSNLNIHHVSGDSIQIDPNRVPGNISNNIVIERAELWTGPLASDFNAGWQSGDVPGENALDTKVVQSGFDGEPRMVLSLTDIEAYGWTKGSFINNRAAFNLKEKIDVTLDRITVYDSEIAFRIRGSLGNANARIQNVLIYDVDKAFRAENNLQNLRVYNATLGRGIGELLETAGGAANTSSWDWRNIASYDAIPTIDSNATQVIVDDSDFINSTNANYRLASGSSLINAGVDISGVDLDRDGRTRDGSPDIGAFELGGDGSRPNPPVVTP